MNGHQRQQEISRHMIEDAFFMLLGREPYERITVSEIADKAEVSRRTFYRLYGGKEEVLRNWLERLCEEYRTGYPALEKYDIRQISMDYFQFWYRHRERLLLMHKNGLGLYILYYATGHLSHRVMEKRIGEERAGSRSQAEYFMEYSAGGFGNLLFRWLETGMKESPQEYAVSVSNSICRILSPSVET
ncbi:MAG: TetR/AcrR family transcriptional regulator [Dorea sp.]|uniref:TetR/AcrR family transcriptional regulator n=1 Tax=Dorea sp. YH-dor226 TaxID=3151119 RepID=UPI00303EB3DC|nr:TetR/AcrR family transcriptional regulator [Dorea sp.]